ncbi:hypothetical protein [Gimesia aquarii]|uniref:Uncharacterized protein n=1 Tax=Gimesia aquarii TaxID=2527964 RepID=A0A517X1P0_9PLAN|nr:hypothetical protein [Gimesia aquarii]QDU11425.1 hypothetical protein V202x_48470 [Gimesia aquarii]
MKIKKQINPVKVWKWTVNLLLLICGGFTLLGFLLADEWFFQWSLIFLVPFVCVAFAPSILAMLDILFKKRDDQ